MSTLPGPEAVRLSRPRWLDARLILGVVLVFLSVVLVAKIVAEADDSVAVWSVARPLAPGVVVSAEDIRQVEVSLSEGMDLYLRADDDGPVGLVATRELRVGELLPVGALARSEDTTSRRVTIGVPKGVAAGLSRGALVDVYVLPDASRGAAAKAPVEPAQRVLTSATVVDVPEAGGRLGSGSAQSSIVVSVEDSKVQGLLTAMATGDVTLVEVPKSSAVSDDKPARSGS